MKNKALVLNNRYQIIGNLRRGSFGETFLATDTHLPSRKKCVIKQLKPRIEQPEIPEWMQERFQQEARILEHLGEQHRQIPCLYAYFSEAGNFYLVQEWIEGLTLKEKVEKEGTLSEAAVTKILISTLLVLQYVHNQSIVHRDVKPDNIILRSSDSLPVLIDFGAVKEAMTTVVTIKKLSDFSMAIGTPNYMAPEQAVGRPVYASDLYSLGLTAVYLLTGKSLQELETDAESGEILWREAAFQTHPHLDPHLANVLERAIRLHPRDRFASAAEMLLALDSSHTNPPPAISTLINRTKIETFHPNNQEILAFSKDTRWLKASFPLLITSAVTIASFNFGLNALRNRERASQPDISPQPDEQILPPEDTNSPYPEQPETNTPKPNSEAIQLEEITILPSSEPSSLQLIPNSKNNTTSQSPHFSISLSPNELSIANLNKNDFMPSQSKPKPIISAPIPTIVTGIDEAELVKLLSQPTSSIEKQIQIQTSEGSVLLEKKDLEEIGEVVITDSLASDSSMAVSSPDSVPTSALSLQMANDITRGLVIAGNKKKINYGTTMYRQCAAALVSRC